MQDFPQKMPRFVVAQLGARMHYAVPRILYKAGALARFFTDICIAEGKAGVGWKCLGLLKSKGVKRLLGRRAEGLPANLQKAFPSFGLEYLWRISRATSKEDQIRTYLWAGRTFGQRVVREGFGNASDIYAFNTSSLEMLVAARTRTMGIVLEQTIAPHSVERKLLEEERAALPEWEADLSHSQIVEEFEAREREEWECADRIICGSEYVREAIGVAGGPLEKCHVVPYGIDWNQHCTDFKENHDGPLRVLTVGTLGLRKGTAYLLQAAKRLRGRAVVRLVGKIELPEVVVRDHENLVEFTGPVVRSEISKQFEWADVFVLPSICEGSATAVYEALGAGLPVICTPNTGSIVRDGIDGYIVPIRNSEALAERLELLAGDSSLRMELSRNALRRAEEGSIAAYSRRLLSILLHLQGPPR